jgi:hypothetical protein
VNEILTFSAAEVAPAREAVLAQLGIPPLADLPPRNEGLLDAAATLFAEHVAPVGVMSELPPEEFAQVYRGEGRNARESPLAIIAGRAEHLALFAVTLGQGIGDALSRLFAAEDFALAYMLDAMASVAADRAAETTEGRFESALRARGWVLRLGRHRAAPAVRDPAARPDRPHAHRQLPDAAAQVRFGRADRGTEGHPSVPAHL